MTEYEAIATCCRNAAKMLEIADDGKKRSAEENKRLQNANCGQAELLRQAAEMVLRLGERFVDVADAQL